MEYRQLGKTDIKVSEICLGTMTYGKQNSEAEAHEQLDYALDHDINFVDTAELYAVPGEKETQGLTEKYIGTWLHKSGKRDKIILATKVVGPNPGLSYIAPNLGFSRDRILDAIDKNLSRLQTDYIDLYQFHWPERKTNCFGVRGYAKHDAEWEDNFEEAIGTLNELVGIGKIRHWGLSNETPWSLYRSREVTGKIGMEMAVSIQNPYSLLNRSFETGLAEIAIREKIGLLAYSPLAFGLLSGKYHHKTDKPTDRINQFKVLSRYNSANSFEAAGRYVKLAEDHDLSPSQMSLAFINQMEFVTSNIIGATTMAQLKENIGSAEIKLSEEVLKGINDIYNEIPDPAI